MLALHKALLWSHQAKPPRCWQHLHRAPPVPDEEGSFWEKSPAIHAAEPEHQRVAPCRAARHQLQPSPPTHTRRATHPNHQLFHRQRLLPPLPALHRDARWRFDSISEFSISYRHILAQGEMQRLMKRGDPFLEGLRTVVMCYRTLPSFHTDRSFRHLESPHLLFPTLIRTSFSLGMQLRQTRSQSHPCSCSHPQTDFFCC